MTGLRRLAPGERERERGLGISLVEQWLLLSGQAVRCGEATGRKEPALNLTPSLFLIRTAHDLGYEASERTGYRLAFHTHRPGCQTSRLWWT